MDTNKCKALLKVLETGNLSEAAEELGYTPSGISRMMSSLEEETGFALLARSRSGVKATTACEAMLPTIKEVVRVGEHYAQEASELTGGVKGEVRIGTAYAKFYLPLSDIIGKFSEGYPGIRISIREGRSRVLMNEVEEQNLDFCIISKREGNADWTPLFSDPMVAWVPEDHPAGKTYNLSQFQKDPYILMYEGEDSDSIRVFGQHEIDPAVRYTTSDISAAYAMVEAGLGVTLVNGVFSEQFHGKVRVLPLRPAAPIEIGIAVIPEETISPAAKLFRDFAIPALKDAHGIL